MFCTSPRSELASTRKGRAFPPRRQLLLRTTCFHSRLLFRPYKKRELFPRPGSSSPNSATRRRSDPAHEARGPISRVEARESVLDSLLGRRLSKQRVLRLSPVALRRGYTAIDCRSRADLLLFGLRGSRLNVCYCHRDLRGRPLQPHSRVTFCATGLPAYTFDEFSFTFQRSLVSLQTRGYRPDLQRHPFLGLIDSAGDSEC